MSQQPDDKDLVDRFAAMRRAERGAAPTFASVTERATRQRRLRLPLAIGLAAGAVAATIAVVMANRDVTRTAPPVPLDLGAVHWTAPTDFLLNVTGYRLLREVPTIAPVPTIQLDTTSHRRISS